MGTVGNPLDRFISPLPHEFIQTADNSSIGVAFLLLQFQDFT